MSGIEPVFWKSFHGLGRAYLRRYLASTLVYCLVLSSWSYAVNRLFDSVFGASFSWWWIVGLGSLLLLLVHLRMVRAFSTEWVEQRSRKLFSHDELGSALDFLKRPHPSTFMKAHLINTSRALAGMRVPRLYFFSKRHWLLLGSLSLVWIPSAWWASPATRTQLVTAGRPPANAQFQPPPASPEKEPPSDPMANKPQSRDEESPGDEAANKRAALDNKSEGSRQDQEPVGSSAPSEDEIKEGEPLPSEGKDQPESRRLSGPLDQESALSARSGLSMEGRPSQDRDGPESSQTQQASTLNRSEPKIDRFLLTRSAYSERLSSDPVSRRVRTGLNVSGPQDARQNPDAEEAGKGGASGAVGSGEGSKQLGAATDIRASFYEAPVQGIAGDGPSDVRTDTLSDRELRSSSWRGNLKNEGSAFRKKQALPDFYQALVENYFRSTRAKRPDQSH